MSSPTGVRAANTVLAWIDGPPNYHPESTETQQRSNREALARYELERQELCKKLVTEKLDGRWNSFVRNFRLWWNNCAELATPKTPAETPVQPTPAKVEIKTEPKSHWSRYY